MLSLVVLFPSCSPQSVASPDELRSNLNSAVSFASEAETFIDYALEGRTTRHYAEGHLDYLGEEINQLGKELNNAHPPANAGPTVQECRRELALLYHEVKAVRAEIRNPQALESSKVRIANIRATLQKAKSSL